MISIRLHKILYRPITGGEQRGYLADPQQQNSYSYVSNNPLKYVDPKGEFEVLTLMLAIYGSVSLAADIFNWAIVHIIYPEVSSDQERFDTTLNLGVDIGSGGAGKFASPLEKKLLNSIPIAKDGLSMAGDFARDLLFNSDIEYTTTPSNIYVPNKQSTANYNSQFKSVTTPSTYNVNGVLTQPNGGGTRNSSISNNGVSVSLPGSPPRSKDPVGVDQKSGSPIYCWGACGQK